MKKQLLGVALSALMFATVGSARSFDGGFAGVNVGYKASNFTLKSSANTSLKVNPSGLVGEVTGGYGETMGSVYVGGDARLGYDWAKETKTLGTWNQKLQGSWNAGIAALVGGECTSNCLAFFRLGLDYNKYKTSGTNGAVNLSNKFSTWSVVPGLGIKWKVKEDWYVTGMYEYSYKIAAKKFNGIKIDKATSNAIKVGVGYQF